MYTGVFLYGRVAILIGRSSSSARVWSAAIEASIWSSLQMLAPQGAAFQQERPPEA